MSRFNKSLRDMGVDRERLVKRSFGAFFIVWALSAIASLALTGALIYVAWHFISKFW